MKNKFSDNGAEIKYAQALCDTWRAAFYVVCITLHNKINTNPALKCNSSKANAVQIIQTNNFDISYDAKTQLGIMWRRKM